MKTNKLLNGIIAIIVACILAAGVCCMGFASRNTDGKWFGNFKDLSTWHWLDKTDDNKPDTPDTPDTPDNPDISDTSDKVDNGNNVQFSFDENNAFDLSKMRITSAYYEDYGISSQSDSVNMISVTNPVDGYTYHWSLSSGGNTYITLSATTGTSVILDVKQAFGTPITLTCTPKLGESSFSSASCTIGYYKRPTAVYYNGSYRANGSNININGSHIQDAFVNTNLDFTVPSVSSLIQFGTGTVNCELTSFTVKITESTTNFSWAIGGGVVGHAGALPTIAFKELLVRYTYGADLTSSQVNSYYTGMGQMPAAYFNWYYDGNASQNIKGVKGKTFKVEYSLTFSDTSRNTTLSFNLKVPENWAVPYTASLNSSEIVL